MKKGMILTAALAAVGADHGVLLEPAGEHDDHDASNHSHGSAATAHTNDNNNDTYGRRLLSWLLQIRSWVASVNGLDHASEGLKGC